jgi:hypothetical protein
LLGDPAVLGLAFPHLILASTEKCLGRSRAIFAKKNARNVEREIWQRLTKADEGAKYGIPDSSCRRNNDGVIRQPVTPHQGAAACGSNLHHEPPTQDTIEDGLFG